MSDETAPLLDDRNIPNLARTGNGHDEIAAAINRVQAAANRRAWIYAVLTAVFVVALVSMLFFWDKVGSVGRLPSDPHEAALVIMKGAPVIDGHIDLPGMARWIEANNVSAIDLSKPWIGHVDIPRLREGHVGGFFWSTYVDCPAPGTEGKDFLNSTWRVRDTLEQIDVSKLLIQKHSDTFEYATTAEGMKTAMSRGKIASVLGIEGGHQLGNSIQVLRMVYELGVRYVTLTHTCHNAFADSCGFVKDFEPYWGGLSPLGLSLIDEMNRIGMLVDLSHTSDDTARQALKHSKAPVMWSHSSSRAVYDHARNVPDDVLKLVGFGRDQKDAVIMVNFYPEFVKGKTATVQDIADHVDHIANVTGRSHVGIGSDYDGIGSVPEGLEDVSKYPNLIAELYSRGWTAYELAGLTGGNFLRVMAGAERVAAALQKANMPPITAVYDKRTDMNRSF
ncbi:membrane dipeptidase-domain-containing protein [Epithele typhae]|uniref:membrane dipeptidase-domain-containing protein n=1 Tax=Epithele typhae TaxID=378194 RepID=UPI002007C94F|nr:membrane dipeptidase-domain-containing protein [Epithele typhae]KAH9946097.1 membrane dipeptidase-domain-containing protein [Epithele typhae]